MIIGATQTRKFWTNEAQAVLVTRGFVYSEVEMRHFWRIWMIWKMDSKRVSPHGIMGAKAHFLDSYKYLIGTAHSNDQLHYNAYINQAVPIRYTCERRMLPWWWLQNATLHSCCKKGRQAFGEIQPLCISTLFDSTWGFRNLTFTTLLCLSHLRWPTWSLLFLLMIQPLHLNSPA
jgi:hypothetical protein